MLPPAHVQKLTIALAPVRYGEEESNVKGRNFVAHWRFSPVWRLSRSGRDLAEIWIGLLILVLIYIVILPTEC